MHHDDAELLICTQSCLSYYYCIDDSNDIWKCKIHNNSVPHICTELLCDYKRPLIESDDYICVLTNKLYHPPPSLFVSIKKEEPEEIRLLTIDDYNQIKSIMIEIIKNIFKKCKIEYVLSEIPNFIEVGLFPVIWRTWILVISSPIYIKSSYRSIYSYFYHILIILFISKRQEGSDYIPYNPILAKHFPNEKQVKEFLQEVIILSTSGNNGDNNNSAATRRRTQKKKNDMLIIENKKFTNARKLFYSVVSSSSSSPSSTTSASS
jgi:hypothetical protein